MTTVSVVYHTNTGHTAVIAEAVARGAGAVEGVEARLVRILPEHVVNGRYRNEALMKTLDESDAIIFGAPTFMGSISAVFKAFMEAHSRFGSNSVGRTRSLRALRTRLLRAATSCPR